MNKKELDKLKESIIFFEENGFSENGYIAKTVKNFLDGNGEINDDSIKLSNEYRSHLIRVLKAGIKVPQLIKSAVEEKLQEKLNNSDVDSLEYKIINSMLEE